MSNSHIQKGLRKGKSQLLKGLRYNAEELGLSPRDQRESLMVLEQWKGNVMGFAPGNGGGMLRATGAGPRQNHPL